MYLLSGESLTKAEWFRPERQPLNLDGQKSTSSLTIGPEAPEIPIGAWMLDDEDPGAGIVWRVQTVDTQFDTKTRTVQLEHIANTLKDISIFGEIEPKDITGNAGSTTCTARQAFEFILARHDSWQLGTMAGEFENISNPYSFNGEDLLSAMESVTSSLGDAYWDFDLTSLPFRVNILKLGEDVGCEMRMNRNITTLRKTVDRRRMYTRFYPIGENDIHIDGDYITQNKDKYGLVVKIETDSSKKTKAELLQWAQERLARHCEPSVTITISGIELSEATGEPLDHFREHTKCRVPLPEFGTTITEKVTKLSWRDKINEKKNVTITLANQREDIASIVNRLNKKSAAGARAKAKKDKEDHAWFVDTEDHVGMVAEAIIGQDPDGVDWSRVSSLIVDGEGIHGRVTRAEGYLVTMQSSLEMNEESLRIAFENMGSLRSEFAISAESMRIAFQNDLNCTRMEFQASSESLRIAFENDLNCTRMEFQASSESLRIAFENDMNCTRMEFQASSESLRIAFENDVTSLRTQVTTQAGLFDVLVEGTGSNARIKPARIQASINAATGTSKIQLSADNVVIDGDLITGALEGEDVVCDSVETGGLIVGGTCKFDINAPIVGGDGGTDDYNWGDVIVNAELLTDNKTLRLTRLDGTYLDFRKAVTLSEAWSNGDFPLTINATQTNGGTTTNVGSKSIGFTNASDIYVTVEKNGTPSAFGSSKKLINVPFKIVHHAGGQVGDQNRYSSSLASVDASSVYDNGWNDVVLNDPDWQYPAADHNSDNTTAANSVVVAASAKSDGTLRQKAIPIALTVDTANKKAKVTAGGHIRAIADIPYAITGAAVGLITFENAASGWTKHNFTSGGATFQYFTNDSTSGANTTVATYSFPKITVDGIEFNADHTYYFSQTTIPSKIWSDAYAAGAAAAAGNITIDSSASWSNGTKAIYAKNGSTTVASDTISLPASTATAWENPTGHQWRARLTIGGAYRYSDNHEFYTLSEYNTALATVPSGYYADSAYSVGVKTDWSASRRYKTVCVKRGSTNLSASLDIWVPWINYADANATVTDGTLAAGSKIMLNDGNTVFAVWQVPSSGGATEITVSDWGGPGWQENSTVRDSINKTINAYCYVNGVKYSGTFGTGKLWLKKNGTLYAYLMCGSKTIANLSLRTTEP